MQAVIMAGGEGTRLRSVTGTLPKPMALLAGKPILERILALLRSNGIREVCLTLRYRPEVITDYFGSGEKFGMKISYRTEDKPLGTAGGVKACADFYGKRDFLVISGDCACDFNLKALMEAHRRHRPAVTMALYPQDAPLSFGTVVTDRYGRVISFFEKPDWRHVVTNLVNTGIYCVSPEAMDLVPPDTPFDFAKDLFPLLMERGMTLRGLPMEGYWCDIGTPRAYHRCNLDALDGRLKTDPPPETVSESAPNDDRSLDRAANVVALHCRSRAAVMGALSRYLAEAGADFSDGISLTNGSERVHIRADPARESVLIDASSPELAEKYRLLAKRLSDFGKPESADKSGSAEA